MQRAARLFQLRRSFGDALFECCVEVIDMACCQLLFSNIVYGFGGPYDLPVRV